MTGSGPVWTVALNVRFRSRKRSSTKGALDRLNLNGADDVVPSLTLTMQI